MKKLLLSLVILTAGGAAHAQWTPQATGFETASRGVSDIEIVDENVVWCVAYDGVTPTNNIQEFTRTTDGGATWTPGTMELGDSLLNINNLMPLSADEAWISTINGDVGGGSLYYTADGGMTWDPANPPGAYTDALSFQNVVHFFTPQIGIVQGDPTGPGNGTWEVYRTTDGGLTWSAKLPAANFTGSVSANEWGYNGGNVSAGQFFWFVTSKGNIYRTSNLGLNWTKLSTPCLDFGGGVTTNSSGRIRFSDINGDVNSCVGILIASTNGGTSYSRYTTTNGGNTWSTAQPYTSGYLNMDFIPGTNILVANGGAPNYGSAYSTTLGQSWIPIDTGVQRTSIAFLNGNTGWAGGFTEDSTTGGIFKYTGTSLGLPTVGPKAMFSATPNPTTGIINVVSETVNVSEVAVFDLLGKQVYNKKFSAMNQANVDLSSLNTGSYIMKATSDAGATQTIKILKN